MTGWVRENVVKRTRRSSGWSKVRNKHLKKHPKCAVCGRGHNLQVHHIEDFSTRPELELKLRNLITLCGRCHLLIGHLNNWRSINTMVVVDAAIFKAKIENRRGKTTNKEVDMVKIMKKIVRWAKATLSVKNGRGCKFEIFKNKKKEWTFRFRAANGQILFHGEGYKNLFDCEYAVIVITLASKKAPVINLEDKKKRKK